MSLKSWWEKYEPHVGISSLIIGVIGLGLWFLTWENRSTKWAFYLGIGAIVFLLFWVIRWFFRFMKVNKYVFLTWRQNVGISSLIIGVIGLGLWFLTWENRSTKWAFYLGIGAIVFLLFWVIRWFFRFMKVNKYVFLTWRQNRFAKREKLWAKRMREACSKMMDCQRKIEKKQKERKTVWMQLLDGNEISRAQKLQKIANNFLESADETHEAAMERRIRVLVWLINYDQLDINKGPYRTVRDKYIPHQIRLREDSDIYFR